MKNFFHKVLFCSLLLLKINLAKAEATKKNPLFTRWYQINTPHFQVIFPKGFEERANLIGNTLEYSRPKITSSLKINPSKISCVVLNDDVTSGGFFATLPRRFWLFAYPPASYYFLGNNDWLTYLMIHEYRHVVQFEKNRRNLGRVYYWLNGEEGISIAMSSLWSLPKWLSEGDAVNIETALTKSGRGRIPYCSALYRANLLENKIPSYQKLLNDQASHKHVYISSNEYIGGYYFINYLRRQYGEDIVHRIYDGLSKGLFILGPLGFDMAIKISTKKSLLTNFKEAQKDLQNLWKNQIDQIKITPAKIYNKRKNTINTNYLYPKLLSDGSLMIYKEGLSDAGSFVRILPNQKEKKIITPGNIGHDICSSPFSCVNNRITWHELITEGKIKGDMLSGTPTHYFSIKMYNVNTKKLTKITTRDRYHSPAFSPDGKKIVALSTDKNYNHQITIFSIGERKLLQKIPNPKNYLYLKPNWLPDGESIIVVKNNLRGESSLVTIQINTLEETILIPFRNIIIGNPTVYKQYVFYNAACNGIDNVYAMDLTTKENYQVTSRKYGAYDACVTPDGSTIYFNDMTKDGMDIVAMPFDTTQWIPIENITQGSNKLTETITIQETSNNLLVNIPKQEYPIKRYHRWKHFIQPHSWGLNLYDGDHVVNLFSKSQVPFYLKSRNVFTDTNLGVYYTHGFAEDKLKELTFDIHYNQLYPNLNFKTSFKEYLEDRDKEQILKIVQKGYRPDISLPLRFQYNRYTQFLILRSSLFVINTKTELIKKSNEVEGEKIHVRGHIHGLTMGNAIKKSDRDLASRWRQTVSIDYTHTPYAKSERQIDSFFLRTILNFPGIIKHHSLQCGLNFQKNEIIDFRSFSPNFSRCELPNPYDILDEFSVIFNEKFNKWYKEDRKSNDEALFNQLTLLKIHYLFPLCYPDFTIYWLFYLRRIYVNLFFEKSWGKDNLSKKIRKRNFEKQKEKAEKENKIIVPNQEIERLLNLPTNSVVETYGISINFDMILFFNFSVTPKYVVAYLPKKNEIGKRYDQGQLVHYISLSFKGLFK